MLSVIRGGRVIDPTASRDAVGDVWIEDGRIVERGTHDALLAHGGLYAELARQQQFEEELAAS